MSSALHTRRRTGSSRSKSSSRNERSNPISHTMSQEPQNGNKLNPCSASASFFLYAQRSTVLCLHHDTLAVERRFEKHKEDVSIISVDNSSDQGAGRLVVTYDTSQTAIVWDLFTGNEISRFASFENIGVAAWMRDGSIAFGNSQGNVTLFEPSTNEHVSARTIFDPVTALAPASDCRTFAVGYQNGSILIANLQPSFTILHTLNTSKGPSPIIGLAWHGSSSKQRAEMLATQTKDGDLRVWSVAKYSHAEQPRIIRMLGGSEERVTESNWFSWSKNGRILHFSDGEMRASDVRTKRVTSESVPVIDNIAAIANYGPGATLFTVGRNHTVQQYDLQSPNGPTLVANVQHVPPNAPPTPPDSLQDRLLPKSSDHELGQETAFVPIHIDQDTSEDEGMAMSPLQRIAQEMDQIEEERRDQLGPLSPVSSRASSRASLSSASSHVGRRHKRIGRSSPSVSSDGTVFSTGPSLRTGPDSVSISSGTSITPSKFSSSALRHELTRSPDEANMAKPMNLFPFVKARLSEVKFRAPHYSQGELTPDNLRREMLSVVFGWDHDIEALVRDEYSRHGLGTASSVLLSKWLGDAGADTLAQMVGSETMSSSDWMVLALSCQIGQGSQRHIGEAFVRRLLESNEIHPAVAILLGLGEHEDAIEAYVSRKFYLEAVLLTCLFFPNDWQRQSHLVRKWAETAVLDGDNELAVRCFACTSIESSQQWFSPRAQSEVYKAQQRILAPETLSPPISPPSTNPNRLTTKNASLKLITSFTDKGALPGLQQSQQSTTAVGITPIADTAITPGANSLWKRSTSRGVRNQSETRTATPGGFARQRLPSTGSSSRHKYSDDTPLAGPRGFKNKPTPSIDSDQAPASAIRLPRELEVDNASLSMVQSLTGHRSLSRSRGESRDRNRNDLHIHTYNVVERGDPSLSNPSLSPKRNKTRQSVASHSKTVSTEASVREDDPISPSISTGGSHRSFKGRTIDRYISSLEEASIQAAWQRSESRSRAESRPRARSRDGRSQSRPRNRDNSEVRGQPEVKYVKPAKRSPSSPVPMTSDYVGQHAQQPLSEDERYDQIGNQTDGLKPERLRTRSRASRSRSRTGRSTAGGAESPDETIQEDHLNRVAARASSRSRNRQVSHDDHHHASYRDRASCNRVHHPEVTTNSPTSPSAIDSDVPIEKSQSRHRQRSTSRRPTDKHSRARSSSRKPKAFEPEGVYDIANNSPADSAMPLSPEIVTEHAPNRRPRALSRKELAAKELEERRLSLARRPSVPPIPSPRELSGGRPTMSPRSVADTSEILPSRSFNDMHRSQTVDPDSMNRHIWKASPAPVAGLAIGLPATPRAMRHPKYNNSDMNNDSESVPAVPSLPENADTLAPLTYQPLQTDEDILGPLLPSTTYGQKPPLLRSASAPPEKLSSVGGRHTNSQDDRPRRGSHSRKPSNGDSVLGLVKTSTAGTLDENQVIVVEEFTSNRPPIIAELQHLAGPLPPPPIPTIFQPAAPVSTIDSSGVINIVIEDKARVTPGDSNAANSRPASLQRRTQTPEGLGSKWRNVTERIRSSSKSRAKSPPSAEHTNFTSPYETTVSSSSLQRTKSPQNDYTAPYESIPPPPPPPPPPPGGSVLEHSAATVEPVNRSSSAVGGYRSPKEIRANMPPEQLQPGVYYPMDGGMI